MKPHCVAFVFANRALDCLFSKTVSSTLFKVAHFQLHSTCMLIHFWLISTGMHILRELFTLCRWWRQLVVKARFRWSNYY